MANENKTIFFFDIPEATVKVYESGKKELICDRECPLLDGPDYAEHCIGYRLATKQANKIKNRFICPAGICGCNKE